ncbi:hypothetical protein [Novacetimonas pomaceti]|uniref:hypothetical protein n=1 Tax=Novacetimonas pomaceti TaxID=2021998 RepID=UPI001C2D0977|nr:hypothetical protein [Novacetimonas pomaceti]MBV1835169.1 hypothetical protein [Novacetimonas pomaceti]
MPACRTDRTFATMTHFPHRARPSRIFPRSLAGGMLALGLVAAAGPGVGTAHAQQARQVQTRFGTVAIRNDRITWRGHVVHPTLSGNSGLMLAQVLPMGDSDIVLVQSIGGSLCPATYAVMQVSGKKERHTNFFGTCSDTPHASVRGDTLTIRMPSVHNGGTQHTYTYHAGLVSKDGVLLNSQCSKGTCENYFGDD